MKRDVRDRLVLPVLLPLGILVVIAAVLIGFSRILLAITHTAATTTALIVAGAIVAFSAIAATRPQIRLSTIGSVLGATAGVAMLAGGIALAVVTEGEGEPAPEEPGGPAALTVVAENIAFDTDVIELVADTPTTITMDNRDGGVQHNIAIYTDDSRSEVLFQGELITGPGSVDYQIPALPPGEYYFQCDVHPNMNGTVVVTAGAEGPDGGEGDGGGGGADGGEGDGGGGGPDGGAAITVVASNLQFDTSELRLAADTAATITMDNQDAGVQHNISIYADAELSEVLFQGELISGPATIDYEIPPLPPGEYYFQCDVHPNMNGTVVVE